MKCDNREGNDKQRKSDNKKPCPNATHTSLVQTEARPEARLQAATNPPWKIPKDI
jgi:hypothetical protein